MNPTFSSLSMYAGTSVTMSTSARVSSWGSDVSTPR